MKYYYAFKEGLKLVFRDFRNFIKKLCGVIFFYGLPMTIPVLFALLVQWVLSCIPGIDKEVEVLIFKITATVGQIIPLSIYLQTAETELKNTDEASPELCFAFCVVAITWIWAGL